VAVFAKNVQKSAPFSFLVKNLWLFCFVYKEEYTAFIKKSNPEQKEKRDGQSSRFGYYPDFQTLVSIPMNLHWRIQGLLALHP
jgi:hypothetical protein